MMEIPTVILSLLALAGVFSIAHLLMLAAKNIVHYTRFKSFPKTLEEEKLNLIQKENDRLSQKIELLEKENEQMTLMVLQKLNG